MYIHFHTPREHQNKVYKEPQDDVRSGAVELLWKGVGGGGGWLVTQSWGAENTFSQKLFIIFQKNVCVCVEPLQSFPLHRPWRCILYRLAGYHGQN